MLYLISHRQYELNNNVLIEADVWVEMCYSTKEYQDFSNKFSIFNIATITSKDSIIVEEKSYSLKNFVLPLARGLYNNGKYTLLPFYPMQCWGPIKLESDLTVNNPIEKLNENILNLH